MEARQVPLSMGFSRKEYWSELPFPSPGDLPDPVIKPESPALQADSLPSESLGKPKDQSPHAVDGMGLKLRWGSVNLYTNNLRSEYEEGIY